MRQAIVELWVWNLDQPRITLEQLSSHLSSIEADRADRLKNPRHGDHHRVAHGRLREIIAGKLSTSPEALTFEDGRFGKPRLAGAYKGQLQFNLSHTSQGDISLAALAISKTCAIGVDIEVMHLVDLSVARGFTVNERDQLDQTSNVEALETFYRIWTCKEAALKASGVGLTLGLGAISVDLNTLPPTVSWGADCRPSPGPFQVAAVDLGCDVRCAVAVIAADAPLSVDLVWDDPTLHRR